MKSLIAIFSFMAFALGLNAQTMDVQLIHHFNGTPFSYGTDYTLDGKKVNFSRAQYYLGNFDITHDGGSVHTPTDSWILASGNITDYNFDVETTITDVESVDFNFGVDAVTNSQGTSFWPAGHPLAAQVPNMDWGWPDGYKFFAFEGQVDSDADGVPDKTFQFHGIGDLLLQNVSIGSLSGTDIILYVNVAGWFEGVDLVAGGIQQNGGTENQQISANTISSPVFTGVDVSGVSNNPLEESKLHVDYTMEYAPTIYYDLLTNDKVNVSVFDLGGREVLSAQNLNPEGNFFIRAELETGTYVATFYNAGLKETIKFVVKK